MKIVKLLDKIYIESNYDILINKIKLDKSSNIQIDIINFIEVNKYLDDNEKIKFVKNNLRMFVKTLNDEKFSEEISKYFFEKEKFIEFCNLFDINLDTLESQWKKVEKEKSIIRINIHNKINEIDSHCLEINKKFTALITEDNLKAEIEIKRISKYHLLISNITVKSKQYGGFSSNSPTTFDIRDEVKLFNN
jgi:hypothetical protein